MKPINSELSQWIKLYTKELYQWAVYKTSDKMLAEDLVQDTFLVAIEQFDRFDARSQPKTWLMGILKNKIATHYKNVVRKTLQSPIPTEDFHKFFEGKGWQATAVPHLWEGEDVNNLLDNQKFNETLQQCLDNLGFQYLACVRLKFLEEKKAEEICQELKISPTNYWQYLHRAKVQLRNCIENHWFKKLISET